MKRLARTWHLFYSPILLTNYPLLSIIIYYDYDYELHSTIFTYSCNSTLYFIFILSVGTKKNQTKTRTEDIQQHRTTKQQQVSQDQRFPISMFLNQLIVL